MPLSHSPLHAFLLLERRLKKPYSDPSGYKGRWSRLARAPKHRVRTASFAIPGWPLLPRALRIVFMADLHVGSHTDDVGRLAGLMDSVGRLSPDLVCLGGDYMNGQPFGGGRVPPETIASILGILAPPLGTYAVLGDHDATYGTRDVARALRAAGIVVLENEKINIRFQGETLNLVGVTHDGREVGPLSTCTKLPQPTVVLAHDPAAFADLPAGPHLMLSGHTHGGQIQLPFLGPLINASKAPLRWTYGKTSEGGRHLYVTSGIGTSALPIRIGIAPELAVIEVNGAVADNA